MNENEHSNMTVNIYGGNVQTGTGNCCQQQINYGAPLTATYHLMRHLNVPMMDDYLNREPSRVRDKIFAMHDAWEEIFRSSTFIIYDETMDRLVRDFYCAWHEVVVKSLPHYEPSATPGDRVFGRAEFDLFDSPRQEECFHEVLSQWEPLSRKFKAMMDCIKRKYVIDWDDVKIK